MITNLRIFRSGVEVPLPKGSYRFVDFSMTPISESTHLARAISGELVDLGYAEFRRFSVDISCRDQKIPALSVIWPGDKLTLYSPDTMTEAGPTATLSRTAVPGSVRAYDADGILLENPEPDENRAVAVDGAAYFEYNPVLAVMVTGISTGGKEGKAQASWSLSAEEWEAGSGVIAEAVSEEETDPGDVSVLSTVSATGGIEWTEEDSDGVEWHYHRFLNSDYLVVTVGGYVEYQLAAGAGGAGPGRDSAYGSGGAGGAGAGGYVEGATYLSAGPYAVEVGAGGGGGTDNSPGSNGTDSTFAGVVAIGGAGSQAANNSSSSSAVDGGSSAGASRRNSATDYAGDALQIGRGHRGGDRFSTAQGGAGGGGAGGRGVDVSGSTGTAGGDGYTPDWGGDTYCRGGDGGDGSNGTDGTDGAANTGDGGGGGGGKSGASVGGNGGSGFVVLRYKTSGAEEPVEVVDSGISTIEATGGDLTYDWIDPETSAVWRYHEFLTTDWLSVTAAGEAYVFLVGGAGGSGKWTASGGGGGAGGVPNLGKPVSQHFDIKDWTVEVGAGGAYAGASNYHGAAGSNTQIEWTLRAYGGGGGGGFHEDSGAGSPGGSGGGGAAGNYSWWPGMVAGAGRPGQGNSGGAGKSGYSTAKFAGGGGGGAGGAGQPGNSTTGIGGDGGLGIAVTIAGVERWFAAGGRGGGEVSAGTESDGTNAANTGGGTASSGNSGIAIIYYRIA